MKITRATLTHRPVTVDNRRHPRRRPHPLTIPPLVLLTLTALAFGAGLFLDRLADGNLLALPLPAPRPPTPLPATPTPPPTPTPTSPEVGDLLPTLYLDIPPGAWAKIVAKRWEALRRGILLVGKRDYVPATLRCGDEKLDIEVRLKGDWTDHLAREKWSFRVRVLSEGSLFGMRLFSLQDPSTRSYLHEWLFLENLRREGVLAVRYRFVRLVLNGTYKGIYALEEGFAKELLESQTRREGPIIRYDEDLVWAYRAFYDDQLIPRGVNQFHLIDDFQSSRIAADPALAAMRDTAIGLLRAVWTGERAASEVFDMETMARFLALSDLWSAPHGLIWHNLRYYYNPLTARLEPIAYDSDALAGDLDMAGLPAEAFYGDPRLQAAYAREAWRMTDPAYLDALKAAFGDDYEQLRIALEPEFGPEPLAPPWETLRRRQTLMRQVLNPYRTAYAYFQRELSPSTVVTLAVGNLLDLPLELIALEGSGVRFPLHRTHVVSASTSHLVPRTDGAVILRPLPADATAMPYVYLRLPREQLPPVDDLTLVTRLWGLTQEHLDPILPAYPAPLSHGPQPPRPTLTETLQMHPYLALAADAPRTLTLLPGTWTVNGDLVLPIGYGLRLSPGTTLRFARDHILLADGPLDWRGTADAPIHLEPITDTWGGIVVLNAPAPSFWHYVTISATTALQRQGWQLTGGVTFYRSPVRLSHCRLLASRAEDALNIVRAPFEIAWSEFGGHASDALDVDFGQGRVEASSFHDLGGDAIDVSGSEVEIARVWLRRVADKAISVGEGSHLTATDVEIADVDFGLVSKDLSRATLRGATVTRVRLAALAAYVKKPTYGPALLVADDVRFLEVPPERRTLVQTGSTLRLEGRPIPGGAVDVEALYSSGP